MGRAYRGPYARPSSYPVPYATASVWGTGIDAIHGYYGEGPPLRTLGREGTIGSSPVADTDQYPRRREYQEPGSSSGMDYPQEMTWGYPVDYSPDSFGQGADSPVSDQDTGPATVQYMADRPAWGDAVESERIRTDASTMAPWGTPGGRFMRAVRAGSHRFRLNSQEPGTSAYQPVSAEASNSNPTETVSEGWLNKATSFIADAEASSSRQYEVQTSMRQRYGRRDNRRAVQRATDADRSEIPSRVTPMVLKVYSTGERVYDMYPYQIDQIERPFRYRTAGTGRAEWMETNEFSPMTPVQRTPPPDPSAGPPEVQEYGYTREDSMYYA